MNPAAAVSELLFLTGDRMKSKPGMPFLIIGVAFLALGISGWGAFIGIGAAFLGIGSGLLVREKRSK